MVPPHCWARRRIEKRDLFIYLLACLFACLGVFRYYFLRSGVFFFFLFFVFLVCVFVLFCMGHCFMTRCFSPRLKVSNGQFLKKSGNFPDKVVSLRLTQKYFHMTCVQISVSSHKYQFGFVFIISIFFSRFSLLTLLFFSFFFTFIICSRSFFSLYFFSFFLV